MSSNRMLIQQFITWVKDYNASVAPEERFQGLHFDLETYLLGQWKSAPGQVIKNWMDTLCFIKQEANGTRMPVTLDVPFWLYTLKIPDSQDSFRSWMLQNFDHLVLMDYRNSALDNDGIVQNATSMLQQASNLHKQVTIAVDTTKSAENKQTTFYDLNENALEQELLLAKISLSGYSSFVGYTVHDYSNWVLLK